MVRFENAVPGALAAARETLGDRAASITVVRDAAGRVTLVLPDTAITDEERVPLTERLNTRLGPYSPGTRRVLIRASELIDAPDVIDSPDRIRLPDDPDAWLVDRLLTNLDWLRKPRLVTPPVTTAVGFSLKGGVGRSTALAVLAWHLAQQGKRVLLADLDLEAPGLGSLFLEEPPGLGLIDWLAEGLVGSVDDALLDDCLALAPVSKDTPGIIQVMPAFGRDTREYVAKLGRVFLPAIASDGGEIGLAERLANLLVAIRERPDPPDVVLLDSRAGLHDIGAAAVTQLGAEVFIFARDERQSWQAYQLLFEHLARSKGVEFGMPDNDLRWRLKMVAAQADKTEGALANWVEASYEAWSVLYDDEPRDSGGELRAQTFARDDPAGPHFPLPVYFDPGLRGVSLVDQSARPPWPVIEGAFGPFLAGAAERLLAQGHLGAAGRRGGTE